VVLRREVLNSYTGSTPVLTTEGANPETWKDKVGDRLERQAFIFFNYTAL